MNKTAPTRGSLIVFEGIDGTGKSTQIRLLAEYLQNKGYSVVSGYEPTHGTFGKKLRDSMTTGRLEPAEEIDLFLKDRRDNVENFILPHMENGTFVLLDRYYFSMMAYQGALGHDPLALRKTNEEFAPVPDLVLWLNIPVDTALERIGGRGEANEFEKSEQLEKCHDIFAAIEEDWFVSIDAAHAPEKVAQLVQSIVADRFAL